jgi:hypothetical protein
MEALLPAISDDFASARAVMAFASVDAGVPESTSVGSKNEGFLGAASMLSTADVCWALCSEKRRLLVDSLLPSVAAAAGRYSWPELRQFGIGWWLRGDGSEAQDEILKSVLTKLAQSSVTELKKQTGLAESMFSSSDGDKGARRLVDEAVFWYVVLGANLNKIRALFKTGVLKGDAGVQSLLCHERCGEEGFMRKNAFRLLQLHRFQLAAAIFVLSENYEEAAKVVSKHMCDLQLTIIMARRAPHVIAPVIRERIEDAPEVQQDPWLHVLLAWHSSDDELIQNCRSSIALDRCSPGGGFGASPVVKQSLFDETLKLSKSSTGLAQVIEKLFSSAESMHKIHATP